MNAKTLSTITELFEADHREIDAIFESISFSDAAAALPLFTEFDRRLERHIRWEEELLFPAAASKEPWLAQGPIMVMKSEHVMIRAKKAECLAALRAGDGHAAANHAQVLVRVLGEHNVKEEHVLYPACDEVMEQPEKDALRRMLAES